MLSLTLAHFSWVNHLVVPRKCWIATDTLDFALPIRALPPPTRSSSSCAPRSGDEKSGTSRPLQIRTKNNMHAGVRVRGIDPPGVTPGTVSNAEQCHSTASIEYDHDLDCIRPARAARCRHLPAAANISGLDITRKERANFFAPLLL